MAAMNKQRVKRALSKSILDMKFMQKSKEAARIEAEAEEARAACANELTEAMKRGGALTFFEPSYVPCEELVSPRQSYHGANPEIEKFLQELKTPKGVKFDPDADVQADEVARVTHAGEKLAKPPRKKPRFLKPSD